MLSSNETRHTHAQETTTIRMTEAARPQSTKVLESGGSLIIPGKPTRYFVVY